MLLHMCVCVCVRVCASQGILCPRVADWDSRGTATLVLQTGRGDQGVLRVRLFGCDVAKAKQQRWEGREDLCQELVKF